MHNARRRAVSGYRFRHIAVVSQAPHVVNHIRAHGKSRLCALRIVGIDGYGNFKPFLYQHKRAGEAVYLLLRRNFGIAGARGLRAYIYYRRPVLNRPFHGKKHVVRVVTAAVPEAVGRHVYNRHYESVVLEFSVAYYHKFNLSRVQP